MMETATASVVAGSAAGMLSVTICHPLDVLRTLIQAKSPQSLPTISSKVSLGLHNRSLNLATLYKGFLPPLLSQGLYKSIIFTTNSIFSRVLFEDDKTLLSSLVTGFISGAVCSTVVTPIEIIRSRLILEEGGKVKFRQCIEILCMEGGAVSLWRALPLTMLRDAPGVALYISTFAAMKKVSTTVAIIILLCSSFISLYI